MLDQVKESDGGVLLKTEEHQKVAEVARELQKYCVNEPVKCPLIFGGKFCRNAEKAKTLLYSLTPWHL